MPEELRMTIYQQGDINTAALIVPDLYVQIVPPQNLVLNGVPTNLLGVVGTASWGPVNQPVVVGSMSDYVNAYGPVIARKYDMATNVATAIQQGASAFRCVRVTDGTDTAASYAIGFVSGSYAALLTARYTGSLGNGITITLAPVTGQNAWTLTISKPGMLPEVFANIPATTPAAFWQALVSAINHGTGPLRANSQLVVATLGTLTSTMPAAVTAQPLLGGTDGVINITAATLVGQDILPRTGMYALRGQGCSVALLADTDDSTQWVTQTSFGASEGVYMILTGPAGDTITDAVNVIAEAGLNSTSAKLMFGDWVFWQDQTNNLIRIVSPQGFVAGRLGNLSPEQSSLNKPLYSIIGTQKSGVPGSGQTATYSDAELATLFQAGIDVIANPQPGGAYWGVRCGHNTSSNPATYGDNYSRMTNFIAATLAAGMGPFVGQVINTQLFQQIRSTQLSFLQTLLNQGILGLNGSGQLPFSVICDGTNNPVSQTSLGYVQSDAQVQYQGINEKFIVNVEGGQTVVVQQQILPTS
jgi:phage tail sheath protein FI